MKLKLNIKIIYFLLMIMPLTGYSSELDSLKNCLKNSSSPQKTALELSNLYFSTSIDSARYFSNMASELAEEKQDTLTAAFAHKNIGKSYYIERNFIKALNAYHKAVQYFKKVNNKREQLNVSYNIGKIYRLMGKYEKAITYFKQSLEQAEYLTDSIEIAGIHREIGISYFYWSKYNNAIIHAKKSLKLRKTIKDTIGEANTNQLLGNIYLAWKDFDNALVYTDSALSVFRSLITAQPENLYFKLYYANTLMNIGIIYKDWGVTVNDEQIENLYDKALQYVGEARDTMLKYNFRGEYAYALNNLGDIYESKEDFKQAIEYYKTALEIEKEMNNLLAISGTLYHLGSAHKKSGAYAVSIDFYNEALLYYKQLDDKRGIANCYLDLGNIYYNTEEYSEALGYLAKSDSIAAIDNHRSIKAESYLFQYQTYKKINNFELAIEYLEYFINERDSISDQETAKKISELKEKFDNEHMEQLLQINQLQQKLTRDSLKIAKQKQLDAEYQSNLDSERARTAEEKNKVFEAEDERDKAILWSLVAGFILLAILAIIIFINYRNKKKANYLLEEKNEEITLQKEEILQRNEEIQAINEQLEETNIELEKLSVVASETDNAIIIAQPDGEIEYVNEAFTKLFGYKLEEYKEQFGRNIIETSSSKEIKAIIKSCVQEKLAKSYTSNIQSKDGKLIWLQTTLTPIIDENGEVAKLVAIDSNITKLKEVEEKLKDQKQEITDSIQYASRIQNAILPPDTYFENEFSEYFIINRPKDIVSGDFYWIKKIEDKVIVVAADCTGHGVPGAFMSLLGITTLNEIVKDQKVLFANNLLNTLRDRIIEVLHQHEVVENILTVKYDDESTHAVRDGMDMSLCIYDKNKSELQYAGANNAIYYIPNAEEAILKQISADKMPIGPVISKARKQPFTNNIIKLKPEDCVYMFSDGIADQFGGERGKKFKSYKLKELLIEYNCCNMPAQKQLLEKAIDHWMEDHAQVDDMLLIGLRF
jgi:PAS domain S-box-containing protein